MPLNFHVSGSDSRIGNKGARSLQLGSGVISKEQDSQYVDHRSIQRGRESSINRQPAKTTVERPRHNVNIASDLMNVHW